MASTGGTRNPRLRMNTATDDAGDASPIPPPPARSLTSSDEERDARHSEDGDVDVNGDRDGADDEMDEDEEEEGRVTRERERRIVADRISRMLVGKASGSLDTPRATHLPMPPLQGLRVSASRLPRTPSSSLEWTAGSGAAAAKSYRGMDKVNPFFLGTARTTAAPAVAAACEVEEEGEGEDPACADLPAARPRASIDDIMLGHASPSPWDARDRPPSTASLDSLLAGDEPQSPGRTGFAEPLEAVDLWGVPPSPVKLAPFRSTSFSDDEASDHSLPEDGEEQGEEVEREGHMQDRFPSREPSPTEVEADAALTWPKPQPNLADEQASATPPGSPPQMSEDEEQETAQWGGMTKRFRLAEISAPASPSAGTNPYEPTVDNLAAHREAVDKVIVDDQLDELHVPDVAVPSEPELEDTSSSSGAAINEVESGDSSPDVHSYDSSPSGEPQAEKDVLHLSAGCLEQQSYERVEPIPRPNHQALLQALEEQLAEQTDTIDRVSRDLSQRLRRSQQRQETLRYLRDQHFKLQRQIERVEELRSERRRQPTIVSVFTIDPEGTFELGGWQDPERDTLSGPINGFLCSSQTQERQYLTCLREKADVLRDCCQCLLSSRSY